MHKVLEFMPPKVVLPSNPCTLHCFYTICIHTPGTLGSTPGQHLGAAARERRMEAEPVMDGNTATACDDGCFVDL